MNTTERWATVALGLGAFTGGAAIARRGTVPELEDAVFRSAQELPARASAPLTVVMQAGSLGAVFAAAALLLRRDRQRAAVVLGTGSAVWAACKVAKRSVGRGRPTAHLERVVIRGREETGLGYPSGHAAVACTLAGLLAPRLPAAARPAAWGIAGTVGLARMYVGAHLPLDIAGGAALGAAVVAAVGDVGTRRALAPRAGT